MADAYKFLTDTSLPRTLRRTVNIDGVEVEEVSGQIYAAGEYVLASEMTQVDQERAENGELDHLMEKASVEEAEEARAQAAGGLFIPEHEAERYALLDAGHRVVERDQVLELRSAGAEAAAEAFPEYTPEAQIVEQSSYIEVPALSEGVPVVPETDDEDKVDEATLEAAGVEMPPGLPVGNVLAKAEGADPADVDKASAKKTAKRSKPGSSSSSSSSGS